MSFKVGDIVIHWAFGVGEIMLIEEKTIRNQLTNCYVVRTSTLTIWIPITDLQQQSLRYPVPPEEFEQLSAILSSPCEKLQDDRVLRKNQLLAQMKDGQLASIIYVVRDLTNFKRSTRLNDREKAILALAVDSLLTEWIYSLGTPLGQARQTMMSLLESR
jgi:RNA polymerase-interacting CarD/CdnL/TRCF family regulator